jgi:hypothetical protein
MREGDRGLSFIDTEVFRFSAHLVLLSFFCAEAWVNSVIEGLKGDYLKPDRKTGSCKPRGKLKKSGLWSLRCLNED